MYIRNHLLYFIVKEDKHEISKDEIKHDVEDEKTN